MSDQHDRLSTDRRTLMTGAAAAAAAGSFLTPSVAGAAAADLAAIRKAVEADKADAIKRLQEWIALPTVAAEGLNVNEGPAYMAKIAKEAGFQTAEIIPTDGVDGVFATLDVGAKRWIGVYFMYDVKQYDPKEWSSPPLEGKLVEKAPFGTVMVGRGATNSKGGQITLLNALRAMRAVGKKPPVNIALICEGEEEIASPHFRQIATHPKVLPVLQKCEGIYVPGPAQDRTTGEVSFTLSAKGPVELQLTVDGSKTGIGPKADIHSSEKGRIDSPIWRLVQALATLTTPDGNTPTLDGFMDKVRPLTPREKELISQLAKKTSEDAIKQAYGNKAWIDNMTYEQSIERLLSQPTINIQGLIGGYTGPGGKTVLPSKAEAKLEIRMVPNQTYAETVKQVRAHLDKRGFQDVAVNISGGYDPTETAEDASVVQAALAAYKKMGIPVTLSPRSAGSWPGSLFTQPPVSKPAIHYGVGFGSGAHAPDEFIVIDSANPKVAGYVDATMAQAQFLYALAEMK
jgi:acetylornithine deacetylase/succinyl-diaminopimelate desuccinylase-like protein